LRPEITFTVALDSGSAILSESARECLFRAAQEGISNAVRHGHPTAIALTTSMENGWIRQRIADDGAGGPEGTGLGLPGMRARAAALGGHVTIQEAGGWIVTVAIPAMPQPVRTASPHAAGA
jgi:two-component system sensor histidine kinase UhpB